MNGRKRCNGCDEVKGADEFSLTASGSLRSRCKSCINAYNKAHRAKAAESGYYRTEQYRQFNRERMRVYRRGPAAQRLYARTRAYALESYERRNAWKAVERAIHAGRLVRPDRCACGRDGVVQAHHDDYSKPIDVLWLCAACHKARHAWLKEEAAA